MPILKDSTKDCDVPIILHEKMRKKCLKYDKYSFPLLPTTYNKNCSSTSLHNFISKCIQTQFNNTNIISSSSAVRNVDFEKSSFVINK